MSSRPSLVRSIPFWALVAGSVASLAVGGTILADKIGVMTATLTDGSATGIEVYVGQTLAVFGAVLVGAGVIGILISLDVAAAASLRPVPAVEVVEPIDWTAEDEAVAETEAEAVAEAEIAPAAEASEPAAPVAATAETVETPEEPTR